MSVMTREVRFVGAAILLVVSFSMRARADCSDTVGSNAKLLRPQQVLARYDLVFTGKVIRGAPYSAETLFEVDRVWKGTLYRHASLLIAAVDRQWAKAGHTYLMLLWECRDCVGRRLIYEVGCTGGMDTENDDALNLLRQLGRAKPPLNEPMTQRIIPEATYDKFKEQIIAKQTEK